MEKSLIFFDLGNTLEDETDAQRERTEKAVRACGELGLNITARSLLDLMDEGGKQGVPSVFLHALRTAGLNRQQMDFVREKSRWRTENLRLFPETVPVLEEFGRSAVLGIIANQSASPVGRLERYGIVGFFKTVISSSDAGVEKPDPEIFRMALSRTMAGPGPAKVWMVGDRIDNDIAPAKKLGWKTVRVRLGCYRMQEPSSPAETPDFTVDSLAGLKELLHAGAFP